MPTHSNEELNRNLTSLSREQRSLKRVIDHLAKTLERDTLVQETTNQIRNALGVDRIVLYYFYCQWQGQVTFESISVSQFSILGSTGADECFNDEYAAMYLAGRVRAIADIELEPIHPCHRDFLRSIQVRANLVIPVLTARGLWGLLVAHHCQNARFWTSADIEQMQRGAQVLATAPSIIT
ncbi:MAG: GAF domain-containing protein [Hydrococcus sp. RU_2_2]|jgi:GAF domain-containing protein|nr:GAF domain-containing protein [Hydrococcus sp. RU_2_2]NJP20808.1 GAF domain-containing protein [Hydrococcus sp. CRU_1_1]NJQ96643.1 GAF domain-containing protein [Hydrococcus sp. CSU_1_8]